MCMTATIAAALPAALGGFDGGVVYIDTEHAFSAARCGAFVLRRLCACSPPWPGSTARALRGPLYSLVQIATSRLPEHFMRPEAVDQLMERVHVVFADTSADLLRWYVVLAR